MCLLAYGRRITALRSQKLFHSFLIINLIFTFITGTTAQSWVEQPKDKNVTVGATVRFPCQARNVQGTHIWNKGTSPIFVDGQRNQGVSDRYQIEGNNTLVIRNVELGDDSFYSCTIFGFDSIQVRLTVLLPPGQPVISINSSSPHVENSVISLNCSSTGGKPTPTVRWLRNGQPITSAILIVPSVEMGTTSSLITVELTKQDDSANFSCIVFNDANVDHPHIGSEILDVQYSPSIQFEPDYSPYYVKLNTRVDLKCVVDANPPVPSRSVQWHKEGSPFRGSTNTLSFNSIQKSNSGNYTCTAFNVIRGITQTARASKVIEVIYAPTVTTQSVIIANISDPVNMTCIVDANPRAREIRWAKVDNSIFANGPNFVFIAQRRYAGNYSCTAVSKLQPSGQPAEDISSTGYTSVQIQYAPGQASISPVTPVLVNQPLVLTCSVDDPGFPLPTIFEWRKVGQQAVLQATSSPTYRIERAQLTNNGEYTCQPRNIIGQGSVATVTVEVNSAPEFVQSLPSNDILTIPISHSKLKLEHVVEGRPAPVVEWYKDGMPVALMPNMYSMKSSQTTFDTYKTRVTTVLSFIGSDREQDRLQINDTGNFTCQVMSSIDGAKTSRSTYLSVEFSPITAVEPRIAANLADMTRIICRVQANPKPIVSWYKQGQRLYNGSQVSMFLMEVSGISRYEGVLQISSTAMADFGEYLCEVNNSKGSMGQRTLLTPRDKPEAPSNLAAVEKTWESVKLKWDPGFNGGYEQTFFIVIRSVHGEKTEPVFPPNANTFNVSRLMPHTSYTFNVYGQNKLGMGANSVGFTTSTDVLMFPPLKQIPEFIVADKQLNIPNDLDHNYCLRVEVSSDNGKVWTVVEPCVPTSEGAVSLPQQSATNVNISVCLVYRPEVCGEPTVATIHQEDSGDLTKEQVIIIGCVCAAILIVLLVILIVIICRRMRNNKNYNNDPHSPRTVPQGNGTLQNSKPRGFDNQDGAPIDIRNGYPPTQYLPHPMETFSMGDTSYDSHMYDKQYEYEMNRRNANMNGDGYYGDKAGDLSFNSGSPRTPTKDPQQFINLPEEKEKHEGGSFGSGNESGYSTPDPAKPKKTWRLNPSLIPFRPGRALKGKHIKKNPDIVPYSHDPPGHTCGLPCCSENLQIQLRIRKPPRSCIGIQDFDVIQQNFTFRGRFNTRTRPVLESGFFSVQAPKDETRGAIPKFGSVSVGGLKRITDNQRQYNFLKGREITLPESKDPKAVEKLYLENFDVGETDDVLFVSDDDIEYYLSVRNPNEKPKGVPYPPRDIDQSIYPWDMLKEMKQNHENGISNNDKVDDSSSSNYYEILRYPDDMNKPLQTTKLVKQFSVAIPPKLPAQTIYNHPPLSTVSSPLLCENYLNQISKVNNQPQKFNTYSTLYSFYNSANQMRDSYERHLSLDRALGVHRAFRPDVRDVSFEYEKSQDEDKLYQTHQIVKEMKKFQKNSVPLNKNNITIYKEQLGTKLQPKMDPLKVEDRKNKIIADRDDDDDDDFGLDNPAFKNINIDGKFHSTKTLNIDGKLRGTRSLDYRQHIQGLSEWKKEQNINKSQSLDYRKKPAGSRVMDMDGNALETKNFEQINNLCCEKLISLMKESKRTENEEEDENPVTLIL